MLEGALIQTVVTVLKELGGYFVWRADDGEEYIVISRHDFDARRAEADEEQLQLLQGAGRGEAFGNPRSADEMLEKINRDLALYQLQREEEEETNVAVDDGSVHPLPPSPEASAGKPGKHVRFEPLRGDLPPELQD